MRRAVMVVGLLALAVLAQLLRQRGVPSWDSVQSDDGKGFLATAWSGGGVSLLWTSYSGYLQVMPRIIAAPLGFLPRSWGAPYLTVTSALFAALVAWFVASAARGLVRQDWLRWALALSVLLLPGSGWETTGVLTQQQFALVFAAFWAIVSEQRSRSMIMVRVTVVVLAAVSAPLALALVPLALGIWWWRRTAADAAVAGGILVGAVFQGITILVATGPESGNQTLRGIPQIYLQRVVASWLVGDTQLDDAWLEVGMPLLVISALLAVALVAVLACSVERRQWIWAGAAFAWSGGMLAAALYGRGLTGQLPVAEGSFTYAGARYLLVPIWLFFSGLVLLAGGSPRATTAARSRAAAAARALLAVQLVVVIVLGFRIDSLRSPGPRFAAELRRAEATCRDDPTGRAVMVFSPRTFYAVVDCDDL